MPRLSNGVGSKQFVSLWLRNYTAIDTSDLASGTADVYGNLKRQLRCASTARLQESNE